MDSAEYPREADSESEEATFSDSSHKLDEEDPLYPPKTHSPPLTPSPVSPDSPASPHPTLKTQLSVSEDLLCTICTSLLHEPMSLHCGHTFCQVCLASMWHNSHETASALELNCPVCRSSWRNFPGINIQLRNIIERTYPEECSDRRRSLLAEDEQMLSRFKSVRERESQLKDETIPNLRREEVRKLVVTLLCIFGTVLALLVLVFLVVFWTWVGAEGEFMRKPATQWTQRDVSEWVKGLGSWAAGNYSDTFIREHISGPRLLQLDETALVAIGIKDEYRRRTILYGIKELKDGEFNSPRNFQEFKAAHRRQTLMVALFYTVWPRITLCYLHTFYYYEIFLPLIPTNSGFDTEKPGLEVQEPSVAKMLLVLLEILIVPHLLVAQFAWQWADHYPWLAYPVLVHCAWEMWREGKIYLWNARLWYASHRDLHTTIRSMATYAFYKTLTNCVFFTGAFVAVSLLWHVTPHFLCDLLFQYLIWHAVLYLIFWSPLWRLCRRYGLRGNFRIQMNLNRRGRIVDHEQA